MIFGIAHKAHSSVCQSDFGYLRLIEARIFAPSTIETPLQKKDNKTPFRYTMPPTKEASYTGLAAGRSARTIAAAGGTLPLIFCPRLPVMPV